MMTLVILNMRTTVIEDAAVLNDAVPSEDPLTGGSSRRPLEEEDDEDERRSKRSLRASQKTPPPATFFHSGEDTGGDICFTTRPSQFHKVVQASEMFDGKQNVQHVKS